MTVSLPERKEQASQRVPPLNAGDRLSRVEFERRYAAMPPGIKAELLEGIVYMPSPVSDDGHGSPHFDTISWLGYYRAFTPGVMGGDNSTLRLDLDNEPQPDGYLRILSDLGGRARIVDGYVEGSPELIAEIAASSVSYDLHVKLHVYRRSGVQEYIVWRIWDHAIDWFFLHEGNYQRLPLSPDGLYKSRALPGLWLNPTALLARDLQTVFAHLQEGINSQEHAEFIKRLELKRGN